MGAPLLWSGNVAKLLKKILNFNDQTYIEAGDLDPSAVAHAGLPGYVYISSNGSVYVKQDSGITTNWIDLASPTSTVWGDITGTLSNQIDLQAALDAKQPTGSYITALTSDITASGPGSVAATIVNNVVSNAKLATIATSTFKGRTTAGTGNVEDLTSTQATALLNNMVGDSGSGGTKGLVPAPAAGDSAAGKFLKASGAWAVPADTGITQLTGGVTAGPGSGSQVATVVTNANLTGDITSSGNATTLGSNFKIRPIGTTINGGLSAPAVGTQGVIFIPYACTITEWTIGCDNAAGNAVVDVKTASYANLGSETSIAGSELPTLTAQRVNHDTNLTTWSPTISAGTWFVFRVSSASTLTQIYITLTAVMT